MTRINILTPIRKGGPYNWGKDLKYLLNNKGFIVEHISEFSRLMTSPLYQNADIIHTSVPMTYKLWHKPVILTVHGEYTIEKNIWKFFYPVAIKKADIITTQSIYLKEKLNLEDAIIIPNAVFPDRFNQIEYIDNNTINIVTTTKFYFRDKSQGILNIIEILDNIQKSIDKKINYTIIGGGTYLEQIKKDASKYNVDVKFTGMLQNPIAVLEENDIFLYYSYHDNFPISILEAMACGLPIVSNDVGAIREMIINANSGFIASDEEYEERLSDLINDCNLRKYIGNNARNTVHSKFNWNIIVNRYLKLYEDVIK